MHFRPESVSNIPKKTKSKCMQIVYIFILLFQNTCDPKVMSTFIPIGLLITLIVLRIVALVVFLVLAACRRPFGEPVSNLIMKTRPKEGYKAKYIKNNKGSSKVDSLHTPKSTTFGTGKL